MRYAVAAIAALVALLTASDSTQAHYFLPCGFTQVDEIVANENSALITPFGIGIGEDCIPGNGDDAPAQYNAGGLVMFTPPEWGSPAAPTSRTRLKSARWTPSCASGC